MSLPTHLISYNNHFYYLAKVPVDLKQYFGCTFIKKSLKTSDLREAKTLLAAMEYNIHRGFTLLRTGMLPDDIIRQIVEGIIPSRQKSSALRGKLLSGLIEQYEAEKASGWTYKTKLEVMGCHKLIVDVIGNVEVCCSILMLSDYKEKALLIYKSKVNENNLF